MFQRVLPAVSAISLLILLLGRTALNVVDVDLWHEMALARDTVASGRVPLIDSFAYTPTIAPVVDHEWGAGMIAFALASRFGATSILLLKYFLLLLTAAGCYFCARRRGGPIENWGFLAVPAIFLVSGGFLPVRAQAYSFLFTVALVISLQAINDGSRRWGAPFLLAFPLWPNLHAGCIVGIVLVGVYACERLLRKESFLHLFLMAGAMSALLMVTPFGSAYYEYLWRALTLPRATQISEYQPVWTSPGIIIGAYCLCVLVLLYAAWATRLRGTPGISVVLCLAAAGAMHIKLLPLFGLVWLCYIPGYISKTRAGHKLSALRDQWPDVAVALWVLVAIPGLLSFPRGQQVWRLRVPGEAMRTAHGPVYPVEAVRYLETRKFAGNLLAPFDYGGYVSWKLFPAVRVFIDSRYDLAYPAWLADRERQFYSGRPGWSSVLTAYGTDAVLVPSGEPVRSLLLRSSWKRAYWDLQYEVYVRPGLTIEPGQWTGPIRDGTLP